MPTLFDSATLAAVVKRLDGLEVDARPGWGSLTAPQMVCHVADAMLCGLGEVPAAAQPGPMSRWPLNRLVIHVFPWPQGKAESPPEFMQRATQTSPEQFEPELERLRDAFARFAARDAGAAWPDSPAFGKMRAKDWGVLGYKHADHHLRQFGL